MKTVRETMILSATLMVCSAVALAQTGPVGGSTKSTTRTPTYSVASEAPHIGSGADPNYERDQETIWREPGYSIGTGSAAKSASGKYPESNTPNSAPSAK